MKASRWLTGIVRAWAPVSWFPCWTLEVIRNSAGMGPKIPSDCHTTTSRGSRMRRAKVEMKLSRRGEVFGENGFDQPTETTDELINFCSTGAVLRSFFSISLTLQGLPPVWTFLRHGADLLISQGV